MFLLERSQWRELVGNIVRQTGVPNLDEAIRLVNAGVWILTKSTTPTWRVENGVIYTSVISNGMTGEEWTYRFLNKGFDLTEDFKSTLLSPEFKATSGVRTEVAIFDHLPEDEFGDEVNAASVRAFAAEQRVTLPTLEVACLIRDKFSNKEFLNDMNLPWVVCVLESIYNRPGGREMIRLMMDCCTRNISACHVTPETHIGHNCGVAFTVSEVSFWD